MEIMNEITVAIVSNSYFELSFDGLDDRTAGEDKQLLNNFIFTCKQNIICV